MTTEKVVSRGRHQLAQEDRDGTGRRAGRRVGVDAQSRRHRTAARSRRHRRWRHCRRAPPAPRCRSPWSGRSRRRRPVAPWSMSMSTSRSTMGTMRCGRPAEMTWGRALRLRPPLRQPIWLGGTSSASHSSSSSSPSRRSSSSTSRWIHGHLGRPRDAVRGRRPRRRGGSPPTPSPGAPCVVVPRAR